jgi:hypothetical protein
MPKVSAFHTESLSYSEKERSVYHNQSECGYGKRVTEDGNAIAGRVLNVNFATSVPPSTEKRWLNRPMPRP